MKNQFQNIEENSISNDKLDTNTKRSKRPFVYTILGLIALGVIGFLVGTKLNATDYQAKLIGAEKLSATITASYNNGVFTEDKLEIDDAGSVKLKWEINSGKDIGENKIVPSIINGKIQYRYDETEKWVDTGSVTTPKGTLDVDVSKDTSYRIVIQRNDRVLAQDSIEISISDENMVGQISSLGYEINSNTENFEIAENTTLTHLLNIQPTNIQNTVEEYIKSIGYDISDFFVIEQLDTSKPVEKQQWSIAFSPDKLSDEFEDVITHNTRYRARIKIPSELLNTDKYKKLESLGVVSQKEIINITVTNTAIEKTIDIKANGEDGPIDGSNLKSVNLTWTSTGFNEDKNLLLMKENLKDPSVAYVLIGNVEQKGERQVYEKDSTRYHLFDRDPSSEISSELIEDSVTILMNGGNTDPGTMNSFGYKINNSTGVIGVTKNSLLSHSWDIQPESVQSTIETYIESIGYKVSDFFTIQRLDISKPAGERQWDR